MKLARGSSDPYLTPRAKGCMITLRVVAESEGKHCFCNQVPFIVEWLVSPLPLPCQFTPSVTPPTLSHPLLALHLRNIFRFGERVLQ